MTKEYSKGAEEVISEKMHKLSEPGERERPSKQKIAIAISVARSKGFKVPDKLVKKESKKEGSKNAY